MIPVNITEAIIDDADKIGKIAYQVALVHFEKTKNEFKKPTLESQTQYIKQSILDKDVLVLKAQHIDEIVGYAVVYFNTYPDEHFQFNKRGFIGSIGVNEKFRRKGVGTALIKAVEAELIKRKISVSEIDVYTFNAAAENLYNKLGYEDIKHYKRKVL